MLETMTQNRGAAALLPGAFAAWTERFIASQDEELDALRRQAEKDDLERRQRLAMLTARHMSELMGLEVTPASIVVDEHGNCTLARDGYEISRYHAGDNPISISRQCPLCQRQINAYRSIYPSTSLFHQRRELAAMLLQLRDENRLPDHVCREDVGAQPGRDINAAADDEDFDPFSEDWNLTPEGWKKGGQA